MPPVIFVGASAATVPDSTTIRYTLPSSARPRDTMIAFYMDANASDGPSADAAALGWETIAHLEGGVGEGVWVMRREVVAGDVSTFDVPIDYAFVQISGLGALVVYRNLNNGAAIVGASVVDVAPADTDWPCPSQTLARYSDLYLGIVGVTDNDEAVTAPGGTTERIESQRVNRTISVFELLPEATGATGIQTATTAMAQGGFAASIALAADALIGQGKTFTVEPIGSFGLPKSGV